jgi:hypothetical protein
MFSIRTPFSDINPDPAFPKTMRCALRNPVLAHVQQQEALCSELGNKNGLQACYGNQALILKARGQEKEAQELLKKQREIKAQIK